MSVITSDHANPAMGRRTDAASTGTAFSTNRFRLWGYNDRSELTSAKRFDCNTSESCLTDSNTNSPVSGQQFTYTFDNIGNRSEDTGDPDANTTGYTANNLHQYTATTSPTESFTYDNDGNLTQDALWDYAWDAENRLINITACNPTSGSKKLGFDYDHMNRRVRKRVYTWNTFGLGFWNTTPSVDRKFVYDGWNLIEELNGLSSDAIITRFTWGLDLSGQNGGASGMGFQPMISGIHGAGGIGGLLACNDNSGSKNYIYFNNANGDVGQLMDVAGGTSTPAVKYESYPYGGELLASGLAALVNPFRFSTKYWDAETQNPYYGERYLRPKLGRWTSRDPLSDAGGLALYTLLNNAPIYLFDPWGLCRDKKDCNKKLEYALQDPAIQQMIKEAKKLKHWWGMPCFGRVRCTCLCGDGTLGWADPLFGDALVCADSTSTLLQEDFNNVVREEIAHQMLMCGDIHDWLWSCSGCMSEEKRAKYLAGLYSDDAECTRMAWSTCASHLGCKDKRWQDFRGVGWPPDLEGLTRFAKGRNP